MRWREIVTKAVPYLDAKGVPDAQVAAELLVARLLRRPRGLLAGALEADAPDKSSLSGKESAQGCIPKRLLGRPD